VHKEFQNKLYVEVKMNMLSEYLITFA